jgi:hypothetical protein
MGELRLRGAAIVFVRQRLGYRPYLFLWFVLLPFRLTGLAVHGVLESVREVILLQAGSLD